MNYFCYKHRKIKRMRNWGKAVKFQYWRTVRKVGRDEE
jgi:hypothetical protein